MNFNEFCEYVKKHIKEYLPAEYQQYRVRLHETSKVNREKLTGLVMIAPGEIGGSAQYLENAYYAYSMGNDVTEVMSRLAAERLSFDNNREGYNSKELHNCIQKVSDFDEISNHIVIEAIGFSKNRKLLSQVPHQVMGDIAAVYRIILGENDDMAATVLINNKLLEVYDITPEQLHVVALDNTMRERPAVLQNMEGIVQDMEVDLEESERCTIDESPMLVVTNKQKVQGAAVLFYPQILENKGINPTEYYIIPSSTHEILMIPKNLTSLEQVNKTIKEINESIVADSEILSDLAHEYDPVSRKFVVGGTLQKEKNMEKVVWFPSNSGRVR